MLSRYSVVLAVLIITSSTYPAYAAQLDVSIAKNSLGFEPTFQFTRIITIQYDDDSTLAKLVGDAQQKISFEINSENEEILVDLINSQLDKKSFVKISEISGKYSAIITPRIESLGIEFNIVLRPVMSGHFIQDLATLDSQWRGFSISEKIVMNSKYSSFDINFPKSVLEQAIPQAMRYLSDSNAMNILEMPLIDANGIAELPLSKWESMFDPTALMSEKERYGFSGTVLTNYSMGICTIFGGVCEDKIFQEDFTINGEQYSIKSIESQDDATIVIEGYVQEDYLGKLEIFTLKNNAPVNREGIEMYVIAGIGTVVAIGFFVWSSKKIKNTSTEQTGIDPKDLHFDPIDSSAGSYRTNRGTAHISKI